MTFDLQTIDLQTALLIAGAAIAVILLLWLLLRSLFRKQSIATAETPVETGDPYAANKDRPYMKTAASPPSPAAVEPPVSEGPIAFHARDIRVDGEPVHAPEPSPPPPSAASRPEEAPAPPPATSGLTPEGAAAAPPIPGEFGGIAFPPHSTDHHDDLTKLKGVGPKLASLLHEQGITQYAQLAAMSGEEIAAIDAQLGNFKGRLMRDRVAEQARLLASGDRAGFEATFGKLGG